MTKEWYGYRQAAAEFREQGRLREAGIVSTKAGYAALAEFDIEDLKHNTFNDSSYAHEWANFLHWHAVLGLYQFLYGAMDFKLAGLTDRSEFCCRQGILIATDQLESADFDAMSDWVAIDVIVYWCFLGHFRAVADMDGVAEAFTTAERLYRQCGDHEFIEEQSYSGLDDYLRDLAASAGYDVYDYLTKFHMTIEAPPYSDWAAFQREHVPEFVDTVVAKGEWDLYEFPSDDESGDE